MDKELDIETHLGTITVAYNSRGITVYFGGDLAAIVDTTPIGHPNPEISVSTYNGVGPDLELQATYTYANPLEAEVESEEDV